MGIMDLAEKTTYVTPMRYVRGRIVEYDIKSANINMLYKYNYISKIQYDYLSNLPKINREIDIGNMIRQDSNCFRIIKDGIISAKKELFGKNNITENMIVRIANDAVYINAPIDLKFTKFDNIEFRIKSISTSMTKLNNILIFFKYGKDIDIDVKGLGDSDKLHQDFMLQIIANTIYRLECLSAKDACVFLESCIEKYLKLEFPIEFYRELNPASLYKIKGSSYCISSCNDINMIDINYNYMILRELWSILIENLNSGG